MASPSTDVAPIDLEALRALAERVNAFMEAYVRDRQLPRSLREAIMYSLLAGGKRLRPVLVLRSCQAVDGDDEAAMPAAAAVEMIHTFSLIHDDLPAMDDDAMRRGRPTLHVQTNEAMAILAGDALSSLAFEVLVTRIDPPGRAAALVRELTVGCNDMIAGQVYDTLPEDDDAASPLKRLEQTHRNKTGALLRASCRMGAICGGADEDKLAAVSAYGEAIGLMFQVVDDLLDVTQSSEQLGKTAGKDVAQGKLTYPSLLGLEETKKVVDRLRGQALDALAPLGPAADPLRQLCQYMAVRTK
jgi:geranylgeranyl diphosphate synthase type II